MEEIDEVGFRASTVVAIVLRIAPATCGGANCLRLVRARKTRESGFKVRRAELGKPISPVENA
jgi:hypothetical protein